MSGRCGAKVAKTTSPTFVRVAELEDVQPGGIIWEQHHPASDAHLLTGAGLVLQRVGKMTELQASDTFWMVFDSRASSQRPSELWLHRRSAWIQKD